MTIQQTEGVISAFFTPLTAEGNVNYELIPVLIDRLVSDGLVGVFVCGSNGEGLSLTLEERMQLTESVVAASGGRLRVIVHVGHASIGEARKLAQHAAKYGVDAISAVAAFYFKPSSVENLVACMVEIAAAAPDLPFYYYHIPAITGVAVDPLEFMKLAEQEIPNFAGIKFSSPELWTYQSCLNFASKKFDVLYGVDENLLPALSIGLCGAIGSTYNFLAPYYLLVRSHFDKGEIREARIIMSWLVEIVAVIEQFPAVPAQKAVMKMLGFDLGPCRLPLKELEQKNYTSLQNQLERLHFFEYVNGKKSFH